MFCLHFWSGGMQLIFSPPPLPRLWPSQPCPWMTSFFAYIRGLYCKPITIVNDNPRVINKLKTSLTDDARVVIYDHHMFIVQATGVTTYISTNIGLKLKLCLFRSRHSCNLNQKFILHQVTVAAENNLMRNTCCLNQVKFTTEYPNVQHVIITQI